MTLIACPECGNQVSSAAPACPSCAYPIATMVTRPVPAQVWAVPTEATANASEVPPPTWNRRAVASALIPVPGFLSVAAAVGFISAVMQEAGAEALYRTFLIGFAIITLMGILSAALGFLALRDLFVAKTGERGKWAAVIGFGLSLLAIYVGASSFIRVLQAGPLPLV